MLAAHDRRAAIDVLRIFATYTLFVFHAGKVFDPAPFFHIRNGQTSVGFYILTGFIAQWHMPLFFVLAGWSALVSVRARGPAGFLRNRASKLLLPLVAGCIAFGPILKFFELRSGLDLSHTGLRVSDEIGASLAGLTDYHFQRLPPFHESFSAFWPTYFTDLSRFTWGHLWFLAYLFAISALCLPILCGLARASLRTATANALILYAPLVPLFVIQMTLRARFPGLYNLYNDWANVAFFGVYFLSGAAVASASGMEELVGREWKRAFTLGTAAMLLLLLTAVGVLRHPMIVLSASTIAGWCHVLGLLGVAQVMRCGDGPRLRWLSESAFPVYVLHQVVIVVIGFQLVRLRLGIVTKYLLLLAAAVAGTLLLYEILRRLRLARFLPGRKPIAGSIRPDKAAKVATLMVLLLAGQAGASPCVQATLYQIGSQRKVILFRWELDRGESVWTSTYRTTNGLLAAEDRVIWEGGRFARYQYHRATIGERAEVERRGGKIRYTQVIAGRTNTASEGDRTNYTVGPTVVPYLQSRWDEVLAGKTIAIRYGVPDRLRSFDFEATREPANATNGGNVVVRFRPADALLRMFIDPVRITLSADGRELRSLVGRVLPMDRRRQRLHPYDAELIIQDGH
jgi:fucose 4-O-acetylase-like acetyltransferase